MKINNFWGDLTDISAKTEALLTTPKLYRKWSYRNDRF